MIVLDVCLILYIFQINVFSDFQREFGDYFTDVESVYQSTYCVRGLIKKKPDFCHQICFIRSNEHSFTSK